MKKVVFLAFTALASVTILFASTDKPISKEQLPAEARNFLATHYQDRDVTLATMDNDIWDKDYEVRLVDGTKICFDRNGRWTEIEAPGHLGSLIPDEVLPPFIRTFVNEKYPTNRVKKIETVNNGWEVEMDNGIEVTFNSDGAVREIDF